jgi:hypothetical protein
MCPLSRASTRPGGRFARSLPGAGSAVILPRRSKTAESPVAAPPGIGGTNRGPGRPPWGESVAARQVHRDRSAASHQGRAEEPPGGMARARQLTP